MEKIGSNAFSNCSGLTSVSILSHKAKINENAFNECTNIKTIKLTNGLELADNSFGYEKLRITKLTITGTGKYSGSFSKFIKENCSVILEDGITEIDRCAFKDCTGLTSIYIPESVTNIEYESFYGCNNLNSIDFPSKVTNIGWYAFYNCSSIKKLIIPNSVKSIETSAFAGCSGVDYIKVEDGNTVYDSRENCNAIIETASNTIVCGFKNTSIPNSVTTIGEAAFEYCSSLTSITIPNNIKEIKSCAFRLCTGLTSVHIINDMTDISEGAFIGCTSLKSINIPNNIEILYGGLFNDCTSLTSITIPHSVKDITDDVFMRCSSLNSITIPNSVEGIGSYVFYDCPSLTSIIVEENNPKYDSRNNCNAIIETSSNKLIYGCQNTIIPNDIFLIEDGAFFGCSTLNSIIIPNGVGYMGDNVFYGCTSLKSITNLAPLPQNICDAGYVFYGMPSDAIVHILPGCKADYEVAEVWRDLNIVEDADAIIADMIDAIGNVEHTATCKKKIDKARAAYDALPEGYQALVKNYNILDMAEKSYKQLDNTGILDITDNPIEKVGKYFINGKLLIIKNKKKYNTNGIAE